MEDIKDVTQFIFSRTERHDSPENRNQRALLKFEEISDKKKGKSMGNFQIRKKKIPIKNK